MSRRRDFEIVFGSDSFLDVIANIVGILIILIVIAGVKVGRMPVRLATLPTPAVPSPPFINDLPETMGLVEDSEPTPLLSTIDPEELPPLVELAPSSELVARVEGLETEIADLSKNSEHLALTLQSHMRQQTTVFSCLVDMPGEGLIPGPQAHGDIRVLRSNPCAGSSHGYFTKHNDYSHDDSTEKYENSQVSHSVFQRCVA